MARAALDVIEQLKAEFASYDGKDKLTDRDILGRLEQNPSIDYHLYTGDFDTLVQVPSLSGIIASERVRYVHFPSSGARRVAQRAPGLADAPHAAGPASRRVALSRPGGEESLASRCASL